MLIPRLPAALEDVDALIKRRDKASQVKEQWRSVYQEAFQYAMPTRETFTWRSEGQNRQRQLFDSTLMEATYTAANTLTALLFPAWQRWAELAPGNAIAEDEITPEIIDGLQKSTKTLFGFLNSSNFGTIIGEAALDLMVGTCAISLDEGDADMPFIFSSIPVSAIEIEEGPYGVVENKYIPRKVKAGNILRLYEGMKLEDLSPQSQDLVTTNPTAEIDVIQCEMYSPEDKKYYGIVIETAGKKIIWRYDYDKSCPMIVARATKVAGETYGRGRILLALPDAKTLDKMQEFVLRQAALQVAPPMTGVSDGVLNPYTATLMPATIIPVASNDSGAPSLRPIELGGNFNLTEAMMSDLRTRVRRIMLGPEPSEGAVKSASEVNINDRNRLWAMNGEFSRIQSELLFKILARCVFILQKKGMMPQFKVNGQMVTVKYTSPFTKSQNAEDLLAVQQTIAIAGGDPDSFKLCVKTEDLPAYVARLEGLPEKLLRNESEKDQYKKEMQQRVALAAQMQMQQMQGQGGQQAPQQAPPVGA